MSRQTDPNSRCTPLGEWPELDREAWRIALLPTDLLDPDVGYAQRWRETTRVAIVNGYGRWLGWMERDGRLDPKVCPGERATRPNVDDYLRALTDAGLADYSRAGRLQQLANALKAMAPKGDWDWIQRASSRIHGRAVPVRDVDAKLQPVEDVVQLGLDLMAAADHDRFRTPTDRATLFRDGLIIAFLAHRPLRPANLAAITLGVHLRRSERGWRLTFNPVEMKDDERFPAEWPELLIVALERYLAVHRPVLLGRAAGTSYAGEPLWVARRGSAMGVDAMAVQVADRTRETFGASINLHSFRHIAGTTMATEDPENVTNVMNLLGHASMRTSEKYYNRATSVTAAKRYQAALTALRKSP